MGEGTKYAEFVGGRLGDGLAITTICIFVGNGFGKIDGTGVTLVVGRKVGLGLGSDVMVGVDVGDRDGSTVGPEEGE